MAKTLTFKQFRKNRPKATPKQYNKYLNKIRKQGQRQANERKQNRGRAQEFDWLKSVSPDDLMAQVQEQVDMILGGEGSGNSAMAALSGSYRQAASNAAGTARGLGRDAANQLRGLAPAAGAVFQRAANEQRATDAAMMGNLQNMGANLATQVGQELGIAGQLPVATAPLDLANMAGSSAATVGGFGSAALSQLLSQGASAQGWLSGLPAAALAQANSDATQASSRILSEMAGAQAQMMSEQQSQRAGLLADLLTTAQEREYQKAVTRLGFSEEMAKLNAGAASDIAERKWKAKQARLDRLARMALEQYEQEQSNRRNREDNETSRANTRDRIRAANRGGGSSVRDRRNKALDEATDVARRLFGTTTKSQVALHENPAYPNTVTGYETKTTYPWRNMGQNQGATRAYQAILTKLRRLLPNAPPMVLHNLANQAMMEAGYTYQAPRPSPRGSAVGAGRPYWAQ